MGEFLVAFLLVFTVLRTAVNSDFVFLVDGMLSIGLAVFENASFLCASWHALVHCERPWQACVDGSRWQSLRPPCQRPTSSLPQCVTTTSCTSVAQETTSKDVSVFSAMQWCFLLVWFLRSRCWADDVPAVCFVVSVMALTVPKCAPTMALTMFTTAAPTKASVRAIQNGDV